MAHDVKRLEVSNYSGVIRSLKGTSKTRWIFTICTVLILVTFWAISSHTFAARQSCDTGLNLGRWVRQTAIECTSETRYSTTCSQDIGDHWRWTHVSPQCTYQRQSQEDLRNLFANKWLVFVGDSITRNLYASLLRHVADPKKGQIVRKAHSDFEYNLPNSITASFFWAPYTENATAVIKQWDKRPDAIVFSLGLWHMLHLQDSHNFHQGLQDLRSDLEGFDSEVEPSPVVHVLSLTEIAQSKLKDAKKKQYMTKAAVSAYNKALYRSNLFKPQGPALLIDLHAITQGCGSGCSEDGVHFDNASYDAAFQIWANSFRLHTL